MCSSDLASMSKGIPGDVVECGVWRGGIIAGIAELIGGSKKFFLFDSFEGLPDAKDIDGVDAIKWQQNTGGDNYYNNASADISYSKNLMEKTGVDYACIKGWFKDTLPKAEIKQISLLRLDGDWYESTMDCLTNLYPKVAENGIVIIDDYYAWDGCSKALHDYLSSISSVSRIRELGGVAYLIKKDKYVIS